MAIFKDWNPRQYAKGAIGTAALVYGKYGTSRASASRLRHSQSYTNTMVTKSRRSRGRSTSLKALVKSTEPAKHYTLSNNATLLHNTIYTCIPTQGIAQSLTNTGRIGDSVYLCALKVKGFYQSATTANAYTFRIQVGWSGEEYGTANIAGQLVAGLTAAEVYLPTTTTLATVNGIVNPKAFTILYDQVIDINSQIAATVDVQSFDAIISLNQNFQYQSDGSVFGKTRNLCVVVSAVVASGASGVTPAGNCVWSADLIFK